MLFSIPLASVFMPNLVVGIERTLRKHLTIYALLDGLFIMKGTSLLSFLQLPLEFGHFEVREKVVQNALIKGNKTSPPYRNSQRCLTVFQTMGGVLFLNDLS